MAFLASCAKTTQNHEIPPRTQNARRNLISGGGELKASTKRALPSVCSILQYNLKRAQSEHRFLVFLGGGRPTAACPEIHNFRKMGAGSGFGAKAPKVRKNTEKYKISKTTHKNTKQHNKTQKMLKTTQKHKNTEKHTILCGITIFLNPGQNALGYAQGRPECSPKVRKFRLECRCSLGGCLDIQKGMETCKGLPRPLGCGAGATRVRECQGARGRRTRAAPMHRRCERPIVEPPESWPRSATAYGGPLASPPEAPTTPNTPRPGPEWSPTGRLALRPLTSVRKHAPTSDDATHPKPVPPLSACAPCALGNAWLHWLKHRRNEGMSWPTVPF